MKKKTLKTIIKWLLIYAIIGTIGVFSIGWLPILGPLVSYIAMQPYIKTYYPSERTKLPQYTFMSGSYEQVLDDQTYGIEQIGIYLRSGTIIDRYYRSQLWQATRPLIKEISADFNSVYADEIDNAYISILATCHWSRPRDRSHYVYMDIKANDGVVQKLSPDEANKKMEEFARTVDPFIPEIYRPISYDINYHSWDREEKQEYHRYFTLD